MSFSWHDDPSVTGVTPSHNCIDDSARVHETAWVDAPCTIGARSQVMHFSHIMPHALIGDDCHIAQHVTIYSGVLLGSGVRIMENARLSSGAILEDNVTCGPSVSVSSLQHLRAGKGPLSQVTPTVIRKAATLGPNCSVASGVTIGKHAFVEANTVIDASVPDYAVVSGNPYTLMGWRCQCGEWLHFKPSAKYGDCDRCGTSYYRPHKACIELHKTA